MKERKGVPFHKTSVPLCAGRHPSGLRAHLIGSTFGRKRRGYVLRSYIHGSVACSLICH